MCIHVCAMCMHMHVETRGQPQRSFQGLRSLFSETVSHWPEGPLTSLISWSLSPKSPPSLPLQPWGYKCAPHSQSFILVLRIKLRSSCLHSKHFTPELYFSYPKIYIFISLKGSLSHARSCGPQCRILKPSHY